MDSPRASWVSSVLRIIGCPPSSTMPVSKVTRVRVEWRWKISATVRWLRTSEPCGLAFIQSARSMSSRSWSVVSSSPVRQSFGRNLRSLRGGRGVNARFFVPLIRNDVRNSQRTCGVDREPAGGANLAPPTDAARGASLDRPGLGGAGLPRAGAPTCLRGGPLRVQSRGGPVGGGAVRRARGDAQSRHRGALARPDRLPAGQDRGEHTAPGALARADPRLRA